MSEQSFSLNLTRRDGYAFTAEFDDPGLGTLVLDEPAPLGTATGPNAARVLGAALGHCLSASLIFCLNKAHVPVGAIRTDVSGTLTRNEHGRLRIGALSVTLHPDIPDDQRARAGRCLALFEDFCVVTASVRGGIDVQVQVEGAEARAAAGTR